MNWIFENLNVILLVAGAIAYWLNQRAKEKAGEDADYDGDGTPDNRPRRIETSADIDQEERARRIREEIQRKIAERRGQAAPPPMPVPRLDPFRPVFQEDGAPVPPPLRRAEPPPLRPVEPEPLRETPRMFVDEAALERQRKMSEELERLEEERREARERAAQLRRQTIAAQDAREAVGARVAPAGVRGIGAELRDPRAVRRAIVMREVLSAPLALR
jgi:hypothetical protein